MGFSDPSANLCDSTASVPYAEASQDKTNSLAGSKCTNTFDDVSKFFAVWNASECLRDQQLVQWRQCRREVGQKLAIVTQQS